jgi:Bifunctional nuclease domain
LPLPPPPEDFFFGHSRYAGAFLLMPQVLDWWQIAQQCFSDDYGSLQRGFLTSIFMLICGIERVFHLDEIDDPGFALGAELRHVRLDGFGGDGAYVKATMRFSLPGHDEIELDCRPSDAIAVALRTGKKIVVSDDLMVSK